MTLVMNGSVRDSRFDDVALRPRTSLYAIGDVWLVGHTRVFLLNKIGVYEVVVAASLRSMSLGIGPEGAGAPLRYGG